MTFSAPGAAGVCVRAAARGGTVDCGAVEARAWCPTARPLSVSVVRTSSMYHREQRDGLSRGPDLKLHYGGNKRRHVLRPGRLAGRGADVGLKDRGAYDRMILAAGGHRGSSLRHPRPHKLSLLAVRFSLDSESARHAVQTRGFGVSGGGPGSFATPPPSHRRSLGAAMRERRLALCHAARP
ncbi:hypothetical protein AAFF_G00385320 [Aldrovandia affinis]|uniref:Uncharacterized protein n=1 Tax=Aldrovandia affinis TaxID=143900 RepID=A0AAD7SH20_9TELE|nr:hypothetical protein AAFF_G00385320 [Aldrovandia affinis]